ncbi:ABC-type multidrug transport system, ATPase component [Mesonia phycicola]|uniref:ABC-type multidrug transport system, ATPase component n=1 Tax=Mesonia phycicola TaxID=579105 RepID=A0A1M6A2M9_9FLAO|nr:ATP-binding cassette domain-containing protein [Mesonia phycicola]SHI30569.1 ABC-type multidrug transport system, ATPase component [Mesonia phycicola]
MDVLDIANLNKSYGKKTVLNNIKFSCQTGEIIGIFGRNGSGKSTLFKIIFGVTKADSIQLKINSNILPQKEVIASKKIGYLPQDSFLPKELKVRDVIPLFFSSEEQQDKVFYAPQVYSFDNVRVGELSLGQLRYLELLIFGNLNHPFILLDEPFSMIEPLYKEVIKEFLQEIKKTKGIILTDHYYNDVLGVTNRNFVLKDATLISINNKKDLEKFNYLTSNL